MLKEEVSEVGLDGYSRYSEGLSLPFRHRWDRLEWREKQLKCPLAYFLHFMLTRFLQVLTTFCRFHLCLFDYSTNRGTIPSFLYTVLKHSTCNSRLVVCLGSCHWTPGKIWLRT